MFSLNFDIYTEISIVILIIIILINNNNVGVHELEYNNLLLFRDMHHSILVKWKLDLLQCKPFCEGNAPTFKSIGYEIGLQ